MDTMTLKQTLQTTYRILQGISVPIGLMEQIALPIMNAMENIGHCVDAIKDPPPAQEEPKTAEDEPDPNEEKAIREEDL